MLLVISPAKTLDFDSPLQTQRFTQPELRHESSQLITLAKQLSPAQLASLMKISDKLAHLNVARFNQWHSDFTLQNARQALLAFKGDVYTGLQAENFSNDDFSFAQKHLRILSGLYGVLRPLDLMQAYRLEMGVKLANPRGKDLYAFWGNIITDTLNLALQQQQGDLLINLASDEYFKAINTSRLNARIIKPVFLDQKKGQYKVISFYAKKARGLMSRYIIQQRITTTDQLSQFDSEGYRFDASASHADEWVFKRAEQ